MNLDQVATLLHKSRLFNSLPEDLLRLFVESCQMEEATVDHTIIREGTRDSHLYFLLKGSCAVTKKPLKEGSAPLYIANINAGESFGEAGVFGGNHIRTANVTATEKVVYLKVNRDYFVTFMNNHSQQSVPLLMQVVAELLERLHNTTKELQLGQELNSSLNGQDATSKFDKFFA